MKQKSIDFRELLERILPIDELMPADRADVRRALESGVTGEIESAALFALSRLEQRGALRRVPAANDATALRYERVGALGVITVPPPAKAMPGVVRYHRAALPARAHASLDQVRRLLDMDDKLLFTDPRRGDVRIALSGWLAQAGREFLKGSIVTFVADDEASASRRFETELFERAAADGDAVLYCPDTTHTPALASAGRARGAGCVALAAVKHPGHPCFGCIETTRAAAGAFSTEDLAFIALLADYSSGVLERADRIEKLMFMDPLTAVYNRSYFDLQLQNEMARVRRETASMALCIVDIDNFKAFNTNYGYAAGNEVLAGVARSLRTGVRPFDTVSRWGGEEFGVLLTAPVQADDVRAICERLRTLVGRLDLQVTGLDQAKHAARVTVSMGVAVFPGDGETPEALWRSANQALLVAKQPPKNQVVFFGSLPKDG
jgi:diguanylate cyclase (GGDEF)-like protein